MKKILLIVLASMISAVCFAKSLPLRINDFVTDTELKCNKYSKEDWNRSYDRFQALTKEYSESDRKYSDAERRIANRAMGRYHALLVKNGIAVGAESIKEFGRKLPDYIKGFADGLNIDTGELKEKIKSSIDTVKLRQSLDELKERIEQLIDDYKSTDSESPRDESPAQA